MKRKFITLLLITSLIFIACTEKPRVESSREESTVRSDTTEFYSFIKKIHKKDSRIMVELDKISISKAIDSIEDGGAIIRNEEELTEEFSVNAEAEIIMQTLNHDSNGRFKFNDTITVEMFIAKLSLPEFERFLFTPFKIQTSNNKIISIKEKYLP